MNIKSLFSKVSSRVEANKALREGISNLNAQAKIFKPVGLNQTDQMILDEIIKEIGDLEEIASKHFNA